MLTTILLSYSTAFGLRIKEVIKAGLNTKSGGQPGGQPKCGGMAPAPRRNATALLMGYGTFIYINAMHYRDPRFCAPTNRLSLFYFSMIDKRNLTDVLKFASSHVSARFFTRKTASFTENVTRPCDTQRDETAG